MYIDNISLYTFIILLKKHIIDIKYASLNSVYLRMPFPYAPECIAWTQQLWHG